ncbi:histidinol-phosphate aminotransferase [Bacillus coahuilensis m2-6]|uniref:histidinol-phosphate transaminase n=1 Tax=Bacillus coahuilensis TaxID=408580 RepID=UPI00075065E6|nr:histidinol-phosphate transaminase [Bacillus coahuilensis]KUP07771.1 histidinol-phosphate aminotransferase [Bacillus coahuilensis m2-6]
MSLKWKSQLAPLSPYKPGKSVDEVKKELGLYHIVKLASNENPVGSSPKVTEFLSQNGIKANVYPDGYSTALRKIVSKKIGVEPTQLLFGNGSDEIIQMISRALLSKEVNTVMATPTFPQYRHNAIIEGAEVREVPLQNGKHDLTEMLNQIDENTSVVWLCSPNNPSGRYITEQELILFLDRIDPSVLVVIDEAYYEYVTAPDYYDAIDLLKRYKNIFITRTFSKIHGLAAFRIGYGIGCPDIVTKIEAIREPFNTNSFAQAVATVAISDDEFVQRCQQMNEDGKKEYYQFCQTHRLDYFETEGNFILIKTKLDSDDLFDRLLTYGYIVRSGNALGYPGWVRITIGTEEQNKGLMSALEVILK